MTAVSKRSIQFSTRSVDDRRTEFASQLVTAPNDLFRIDEVGCDDLVAKNAMHHQCDSPRVAIGGKAGMKPMRRMKRLDGPPNLQMLQAACAALTEKQSRFLAGREALQITESRLLR